MTLPSYYLGDMERKRKRSEDLRAGLDGASKQALSTGDIFAKLQEKLAENEYREGRDKKSDEQFDTVMQLRNKLAMDAGEARTAKDELSTLKAKALEDKAAAGDLSEYVASGRAQGTTPEFLAKGDPQADAVFAEYAKQERDGAAVGKKADVQQSVIDKNEAATKKLGRPPAPPKAPKAPIPDSLRKEFNALPDVKNFNESTITRQKMQAAANNDSPAGDLTLIYSFMKLQDPTSTVRESEFATAARAGSFGDQVQAGVQKIVSGERLTPAQRADFLGQADQFYQAQKDAYDRAVQRYTGIAGRKGLSTEDVVPRDASSSTPMVPDISHMTPEEKRAERERLRAKAAQP